MTSLWGTGSAADRELLDAGESARIFRDLIVPDQLGGSRQEQPVVVLVGGQPGDGKATITALVAAILRHRGRPIILNPAAYEPYHPRFYQPITDVPPTPSEDVEAEGRRWYAMAEAHVLEQRYDAIVETELLDPDAFADSAQRFKAAGYQVEVAILAVPEALSRLGVLERHLRGLEAYGFARLAPQSVHDAGYAGVLRAAELIDAGEWTDRIAVLRPDGQLLYGNQRTADGQWQRPVRTAEAITYERDRPWTVVESRNFLETASQVARIGLAAPVQWIRDESVEGGKTVTAMARSRLHPDAVTLHIATAGTQQ
ncbi:zeta toxin family protein [Kribbella jiaozuonensis]|uniref:UDP-N-acetylglucosamine kinase n=1 Tax=Kribbella jiaozuonensis TaxID=2575441 RepID=A0A4U3LJJ2_9ACTN|nr:zeta toxin family protein [Kribbella jiaozuonensis]TKK74297.1 toxin [Kribbella jiaozuonensis]